MWVKCVKITKDAKNWRKAGTFPEVPAYTYVSDVFPSRFDENIVFASFDNRKRDDFKPYLLKSTDKGKTMDFNKPVIYRKTGTVHTIEARILKFQIYSFVGTESGFFLYLQRGGKTGLPIKSRFTNISVRDIAIQERENDIA